MYGDVTVYVNWCIYVLLDYVGVVTNHCLDLEVEPWHRFICVTNMEGFVVRIDNVHYTLKCNTLRHIYTIYMFVIVVHLTPADSNSR
jgi:hypothetical protein